MISIDELRAALLCLIPDQRVERDHQKQELLSAALSELEELRGALAYVRDSFDHDGDAQRHSTMCRVCLAARALGQSLCDIARKAGAP